MLLRPHPAGPNRRALPAPLCLRRPQQLPPRGAQKSSPAEARGLARQAAAAQAPAPSAAPAPPPRPLSGTRAQPSRPRPIVPRTPGSVPLRGSSALTTRAGLPPQRPPAPSAAAHGGGRSALRLQHPLAPGRRRRLPSPRRRRQRRCSSGHLVRRLPPRSAPPRLPARTASPLPPAPSCARPPRQVGRNREKEPSHGLEIRESPTGRGASAAGRGCCHPLRGGRREFLSGAAGASLYPSCLLGCCAFFFLFFVPPPRFFLPSVHRGCSKVIGPRL